MFETKNRPVLEPAAFAGRVLLHFTMVLGILAAALGIGVAGYHWLGRLGWIDSLLNASMILGGMGPVDTLNTAPAKIFASAYALFSGVVFIGAASVLLAPFAHRMLHRFHMDR